MNQDAYTETRAINNSVLMISVYVPEEQRKIQMDLETLTTVSNRRVVALGNLYMQALDHEEAFRTKKISSSNVQTQLQHSILLEQVIVECEKFHALDRPPARRITRLGMLFVCRVA